MDRFIKMLCEKLKNKVTFSTRYMIKYDGEWETYFNKHDVLTRLIQIDKEEQLWQNLQINRKKK